MTARRLMTPQEKGRLGGYIRARNMSADARQAGARRAARIRWRRYRAAAKRTAMLIVVVLWGGSLLACALPVEPSAPRAPTVLTPSVPAAVLSAVPMLEPLQLAIQVTGLQPPTYPEGPGGGPFTNLAQCLASFSLQTSRPVNAVAWTFGDGGWDALDHVPIYTTGHIYPWPSGPWTVTATVTDQDQSVVIVRDIVVLVGPAGTWCRLYYL